MLKPRIQLLFFFIICFTGLLPDWSFAVDKIWEFKIRAGYVDASPAVGDVNMDGARELVLATSVGRIIALDASGTLLWQTNINEVISTPPVLADVCEDTGLEVLVLSNKGQVVCLDAATGDLIWQVRILKDVIWGRTSLVVADLEGDGQMEILAADSDGTILCLNGLGSTLWTYQAKGGEITAPAVADLDGDGLSEILVGSKNEPLLCLTHTGEKKWSLTKPGFVGSSPWIVDLNKDNVPEIIVGLGNSIAVTNNKGKISWRYDLNKDVHDAVSVGDMDKDGEPEIVVVDMSGNVVCLSSTGQKKWTASVEQRCRRSPTMADIDGDGEIEILIAGYSRALFVFAADGSLKERIPLAGTCDASPMVVDFTGDGHLKVVCPANKNISAFSWMNSAPANKPDVIWPEYRVNSKRTGTPIQLNRKASTGFAHIDYGRFYAGSNEYVVRVNNPEKKKLTLSLELSGNGDATSRITSTSMETEFSCKLPYTLFAAEQVTLEFLSTLKEANRVVASKKYTRNVVPFAQDLADLQKTITDISSYIPQLIESNHIRDRVVIYGKRLEAFKVNAALAETLTGIERRQLRNELMTTRDESEKLLAICKNAVKANSVLAVYGANPWAPFGGMIEIVEDRILPADVTVKAFGGEIEAAALNLANYGSKALTVRVEPGDIVSQMDSTTVPAKTVLTFREVLDVPTEALDLSADALPELGQAQTMILPAQSARQLWVDVNVTNLTPGTWVVPIKFRSLEVDSRETTVSITIQVWNVTLPEEQPLRLCHWGYVDRSILKDQPEAALQDQISHGTNVYVSTTCFAKKIPFDAQGHLIGKIDFTQHDKYVSQHAPHGLILFHDYIGAIEGPDERFSPAWLKAHQQFIREWVKHLKSMGIGYDGFALYPVDEPGLNEGLVDLFINYAKPVREADPEVQIYADPVGRATIEDLKNMAPFVDIWCPKRDAFLLDAGNDKMDFIKSTGETLWIYECEAGAKHRSPIGYYRTQAWLAWHHGMTGIGFWSYCTSAHDPWYTPDGGADYLLIYQGNGVVPSKRWQAIRDGIEDYSMLTQLKKAVKMAENKGELKELIREAEKVLDQGATSIARYCDWDGYGTLSVEGELAVTRQVEDKRWNNIQATRQKIAELLTELIAK